MVLKPSFLENPELRTGFQDVSVGGSHVNGTSRPIAPADAKPVRFAVGGEGEDRIAGQRTVASLLESRKWFLFSDCLLFSWPIRGFRARQTEILIS